MAVSERTLAFAGCAIAATIAAACDAPSAPSPSPTVLTAAARAGEDSGATVMRQEFSMTLTIPAPATCLGGGTLLITGPMTGWANVVRGPNGRVHVNEYLDFSGLTATLDSRKWRASPGAHEIWNFSLPTGPGAHVLVHEGHSRFVAADSAPDLRFVHRIRRHRLPGGELHRSWDSLDVQCLGPGA
jgi:hypothetical protein